MPAPSLGLVGARASQAVYDLLAAREAARLAAEERTYKRGQDALTWDYKGRQQSEIERAAQAGEQIDRDQLTETIRNNQVIEGLRGGELDVSRGEFGLRQAEHPLKIKLLEAQASNEANQPLFAGLKSERDLANEIKLANVRGAWDLKIAGARAAGAGGGAGAPTSDELAKTAEMVIRDPDLLDQFKPNPTLRGQILTHIANAGGEMASRRRDSLLTMVREARQNAQDLLAHPGFSGAFGMKGPSSLFGYFDEPIGGTNASGAVAKYKALMAQLIMPRLTFLHGLGAMSDTEFKTVGAAATSLNRDIPETEARRELGRIIQAFNDSERRLLTGESSVFAPPGGGRGTAPGTPPGLSAPSLGGRGGRGGGAGGGVPEYVPGQGWVR